MGAQFWSNPIARAASDGPSITNTTAQSCLPPGVKTTLPAGEPFWYVGKQIRITASGRISNVVTTPGTARFDVRIGGAIVFDSQAIALNVVAKTNVGWWLDILLTCRTIGGGTAATILGQGRWTSEAGIGSPLPSAGGSAMFLLPFNTAPVVGAGFDTTIANTFDLFFTQTVATAGSSMTLHEYLAEELG